MNNIKISVIVPVYNVAHVLTRCLEYLVHNTYKNLEIIIVDDGSTDKTSDVYLWYKKHDKRIKIIKQKNMGPATARNTGIKAATGEYIHFCDSDDFVNLDYYERMANAAAITDADIICGGVSEKGFDFPQFNGVDLYLDLSDKIAVTRAYKFSVVWRFLYKRSFLEKNKLLFPVGMYWGEDVIFMDMALYYSRTLATACNAVYNCINNPTSVGKNIKTLLKIKANGSVKDHEKYTKFLSDTGIGKIKNDFSKHNIIDSVNSIYIFHQCIYRKTRFVDSSIKCFLFGVPFYYKKINYPQIKYYLFGLRLWTTEKQ